MAQVDAADVGVDPAVRVVKISVWVAWANAGLEDIEAEPAAAVRAGSAAGCAGDWAVGCASDWAGAGDAVAPTLAAQIS